MMSVLPYADIVFGNETEAATYAEVQGLADPKGRVGYEFKFTKFQITPNNISLKKFSPMKNVQQFLFKLMGSPGEFTKFLIY
jgi:hypothetical protein